MLIPAINLRPILSCFSDEYLQDYDLWFQCEDGHIVDSSFRCDKIRDCPDGSDESYDFAGCMRE